MIMIKRGTLIIGGATLAKGAIILNWTVVYKGILIKISIIKGRTKIMMGQNIWNVDTLIIHRISVVETLILELKHNSRIS